MASSIKFCHQALKQKYPQKKITAIFQPHQINRIFRERKDFQKSLKLYDNIIIYDIYAARENLSEQIENFKHLNIENINTISQL
jgi:UDP-N-acetylmuramate--alanine ligase